MWIYMHVHTNFRQLDDNSVVCYSVRDLCVDGAGTRQAPVKSYRVLWPGEKGLQLEVVDKGKALEPM